MRAAGYYPSNADIDSLMAHVAFLAAMVPDDEAAISSSGGNNSSSKPEPAATAAGQNGGAGSRAGSAGSSRLKHADSDAAQAQQPQGQKGWQVAMPDGIDFDTFLCLYVNHRPVAEVSLQQIEQAFSTLGAGTAAGEWVVGLRRSKQHNHKML
jgi:hypothetical protein